MGKDWRGKALGLGVWQVKGGKYVARFTNRNGNRIERVFGKLQE